MAIPSTPIIELPLLLELERHGGRVQKRFDFPAFYESTAKHFPELTSDDRKLLLQDGRTCVFDNAVDWARNSLRGKGELNGGLSGVLEITLEGRHRLQAGLTKLGLAAPDDFIRSARSITEAAGARWQPKARRPHRRGAPPYTGDRRRRGVTSRSRAGYRRNTGVLTTICTCPNLDSISRCTNDKGRVVGSFAIIGSNAIRGSCRRIPENQGPVQCPGCGAVRRWWDRRRR